MEVQIRNENFSLLPQKALFWKNKKTLLISDLHLGKITHFRKAGIAVPSAAVVRNFNILDSLIGRYDVERMILLGDLFHSEMNSEWEIFSQWRKNYPAIEIILVQGNHDILPDSMFSELDIFVADCFEEDRFLFCHHPPSSLCDDKFTFCGHVHPVFVVRSRTGHSTRVPCFVVDHELAVLPSFGVFTGGYAVEKENGRKIFVVAEEQVIKV